MPMPITWGIVTPQGPGIDVASPLSVAPPNPLPLTMDEQAVGRKTHPSFLTSPLVLFLFAVRQRPKPSLSYSDVLLSSTVGLPTGLAKPRLP